MTGDSDDLLKAEFFTVLDAYMRATGRSEAWLSHKFCGSGGRLADVRNGNHVWTITLSRGLLYMSETWPDDGRVAWPADISRPFPHRSGVVRRRRQVQTA